VAGGKNHIVALCRKPIKTPVGGAAGCCPVTRYVRIRTQLGDNLLQSTLGWLQVLCAVADLAADQFEEADSYVVNRRQRDVMQ